MINPRSEIKTNSHADRLARAVHISLLAGSAASALLFIAGLYFVLVRGQLPPIGVPSVDVSLLNRALHGGGAALLDLGVLVLMLTPLLRIVVLATGWALRRDFRFALIALFVLALLTVSMFLGVG